MTKYIYHNPKLRCRLTPTGYRNQIELQLQKRVFIFWINIYIWKHVEEDLSRKCDGRPVRQEPYTCGNPSETYMTGTLDLPKRVKEFFKEYFDYKHLKEQACVKIREITKTLL